MAEEPIKELLEFVKATDLQEIVWEEGETRLGFRRIAGIAYARQPKQAKLSEPVPEEVKPPVPIYISSTMVGTFYRSETSDRPPLVVEGTTVDSGQPVAAIEAMKIMKDVLAPLSCRIVRALVANGHPV